MKKASKWFRGLLGLKKPDPSSSSSPSTATSTPPPTKTKWSFVKSHREKDMEKKSRNGSFTVSDDNEDDSSKHAIAVAAATAAVAEAAVAAAQAAAEVVRLTSSGRAVSSPNATSSRTITTTTATTRMTSFGRENHVGAGPLQHSSPAHVNESGKGYGNREEWAAVKIQSYFRAYLSRRALRALKALVKLQALVRGHIVRKHTAGILREMQSQMQAVLRAQARATAGRGQVFESPHKSNHHIHYPGPATPEKFEHIARAKNMKQGGTLMFGSNQRNGSTKIKITGNQDCRLDSKLKEYEGSSMRAGLRDDERNDKVLEIDTIRPQIMHKRRNLFHSSHLSIGSDQYSHSFTTSKDSTAHQTVLSPSSCEVQSVSPFKFSNDVDDDPFCTAENSPQLHSASSKGGIPRKGPFTPTKSDGSRSCLSGYSDYPNYMSCTHSSKAKMRSLSAPKQRPQYERSSSIKRFSIHGYGELRSNPLRVSDLHANFTSKAYPGSGRLDRLGMPLREEAAVVTGGHRQTF